MDAPLNIAVIGGGSWATALVKILQDNPLPKRISWWVRNAESCAYINRFHHNPSYISAVEINPDIVQCSNDLSGVLTPAQVVFLVTPSAFLGSTLQELPTSAFQNKIIVSGIKGVIPETHQIPGVYLPETFEIERNQLAVVTGPCHAEEVALERLSYLTVASESSEHVQQLRELLNTRYIKTVASDDIYGTEYAAVLKNIYAITAGICHGIGLGDNFQAVLISNAIREMKRFIDAVHPINRDINQSAYLGDLLVTAYSQFSRNRTFGNMLGKGYSVQSAQLEMNMIAEGYYATRLIWEMNQDLKLHLPILDFTWQCIYGGKKPLHIIRELQENLD